MSETGQAAQGVVQSVGDTWNQTALVWTLASLGVATKMGCSGTAWYVMEWHGTQHLAMILCGH